MSREAPSSLSAAVTSGTGLNGSFPLKSSENAAETVFSGLFLLGGVHLYLCVNADLDAKKAPDFFRCPFGQNK